MYDATEKESEEALEGTLMKEKSTPYLVIFAAVYIHGDMPKTELRSYAW